VTYLRFSRPEYAALCRACRSLDLRSCPAHVLRRHLVSTLAESWPELTQRLVRLRTREVRILYDHLRQRLLRCPRRWQHGLSPEEVQLIAGEYGALLCNARFIRPAKRTLVEQIQDAFPDLGQKLAHLNLGQFEALCEQLRRTGRGA
jgi:hypothetical protein